MTNCSYLPYSAKFSEGWPHLETCWSATHRPIQTLAPKENYSCGCSWFLSSYFNFCGPAGPPIVGCNSPLQSTWCRRSWSNWIRSLSSKIWLLSEVSDFRQHNSTPSPYCLTRLSSQPSETASWEHRMIGSKRQRAVSGETEQAPHQEPRKHGWNPVEFYLWRTFFGKEVTEADSSQSSFN